MDNLPYNELFKFCETYQITQSKDGKGTFFFTDCGNTMYSVNDMYAYHKKLCPKCHKTLLLRGTSDGISYMDWKLGKMETVKGEKKCLE